MRATCWEPPWPSPTSCKWPVPSELTGAHHSSSPAAQLRCHVRVKWCAGNCRDTRKSKGWLAILPLTSKPEHGVSRCLQPVIRLFEWIQHALHDHHAADGDHPASDCQASQLPALPLPALATHQTLAEASSTRRLGCGPCRLTLSPIGGGVSACRVSLLVQTGRPGTSNLNPSLPTLTCT